MEGGVLGGGGGEKFFDSNFFFNFQLDMRNFESKSIICFVNF